jgi:hypothetical protein
VGEGRGGGNVNVRQSTVEKVLCGQPFDPNLHLRKPPFVNSTWNVTSKRALPFPVEVIQALVLTEKEEPIGTSGV